MQTITWGQLLNYLLIILPVYYAVIIAAFFRPEWVRFSKRLGERWDGGQMTDDGSGMEDSGRTMSGVGDTDRKMSDGGSRMSDGSKRDSDPGSRGLGGKDTTTNSNLLYDQVRAFMLEGKAVFNAVERPVDKATVLSALKEKAKVFPDIKGSSFEISLTNHFAQEAEYKLGVKFSDEELGGIWD